MKICPKCSFCNEEGFPICVWCNEPIADVPSIPATDPDHPEHEEEALVEKRRAILWRQRRYAMAVYTVVIVLLAIVPGLVFSPVALSLYLITALLVAFAVVRGYAGQFRAALLQGLVSVTLALSFGAIHPLIFFMLLGHITLPVVFWMWSEMIDSANR